MIMEQTYSQIYQIISNGKLAISQAQENIRMFQEHMKIEEGCISNESRNFLDKTIVMQRQTSLKDDCLSVQNDDDDDDKSSFLFEDTEFIVQKLVHTDTSKAQRDSQICNQLQIRDEENHLPLHYDCHTKQSHHINPKPSKTDRKISSQKSSHQSLADQSRRTIERSSAKEWTENAFKTHEFKALPLPDGTVIKNDPYALTSAALGKRTSTNVARSGSATSKFTDRRSMTHRMDASELLQIRGLADASETDTDLNETRIHSCSSSCKDSSQHTEQLEKIYQSLTSQVVVHDDDKVENRKTRRVDDAQSEVALKHHLSKLQTSLKLKHTKCIRVIEQLNHIDALDDSVEENHQESLVDTSFLGILGETNTLDSERNDDGDSIGQSSTVSLYTRQRSWLSKVEARRLESKRSRELDDIAHIQNFSISAVLKNTSKSWTMAKAAHDRVVSEALRKEQTHLENRQSHGTFICSNLTNTEPEIPTKITKKKTTKTVGHSQVVDILATTQHTSSQQDIVIDTTNDSSLSSFDPNVSRSSHSIECIPIEPALSNQGSENGDFLQRNQENSKPCLHQNHLIEKLRTCSLNVDQARKVLMLETAQCNRSLITKSVREKKKKLSPYHTWHTNIHKKVTKIHRNTANRFQSAAIQAKIYADIISRSIQLRQGRFQSLVPESKRLNDNKTANLIKDKLSEVADDSKNTEAIVNVAAIPYVNDLENKEEPYQRYESGKVPFFDRSSSNDKGRFRVRDARYFVPNSIRRIAVPWDIKQTNGVMLLVGRKYTTSHDDANRLSDELVITVLFDRPKFNEDDASRWWQLNRRYIIEE